MRLLCAFAMLLLAVTPASAQVLTGIDVLERRSEEHTSELQSQSNIVCRLLLEKKQPAGKAQADLRILPTGGWFNNPGIWRAAVSTGQLLSTCPNHRLRQTARHHASESQPTHSH